MNVSSSMPLVLALAEEVKCDVKHEIIGQYNPTEQRWDGVVPWLWSGTTNDVPSDHDIHETSV